MNPDTEKLLKQLELATSQDPIDDSELDDQTRELRQGWLAFEKLLETPLRDQSTVVVPQSESEQKKRRWTFHWVGAASALLLVGVFCGSFLITSPNVGQVRKSSLAHNASNREGGFATSGNSDSSSATFVSNELAWDDSFERQLAAASLAIRRAGEGREAGEWHYVRDELMEISSELNGNSL